MSRWPADGRSRLERAAVELYAERGFERTTAAEIAERAGLTERTFFRHFGDKREVFFARDPEMRAVLVEAVAGRAAEASAADAILAGLEAVSALYEPRRVDLRRRWAIIAASPELQERELLKRATWSRALANALVARGEPRTDATLVADVAIAVLGVAFERWLDRGGARQPLAAHVTQALDEVQTLAAR